MKLPGRGEFQIIDYLRRCSSGSPELIEGIGDDCAVADLAPGQQLLTTTDLLTESVHFRLDWTDLFNLGRKAVSVNVSDLAAMGAQPRFLFLSLAIPDHLEVGSLEQFFRGFLEACTEYGAVLAGGDTCRSNTDLAMSVTAQGTAPATSWVSRRGAEVGDDIYLTGTIGDSGLALRQLRAGRDPDPFLLQRHCNPTARVATGLQLAGAGLAKAMIDISDGLLADLEHVLDRSGAGAVVELSALPLSQPFRTHMEKDPQLLDLALTGGEDYELLFAAAPDRAGEVAGISEQTGVPISRIGRITDRTSGLGVVRDGATVAMPRTRGYKHFPETA